MTIPSLAQCIELWNIHAMPEHIKQHSMVVASVAIKVAQEIQEQGQKVNLALVEAGALLHDLGKMQGLQTKEDHGTIGARIVTEAGFPEVAQLVKRHMLEPFGVEPLTLEEQVVNYADKRVSHDKIVSLDERFQYFETRYPKIKALLAEKLPLYKAFERRYGFDSN